MSCQHDDKKCSIRDSCYAQYCMPHFLILEEKIVALSREETSSLKSTHRGWALLGKVNRQLVAHPEAG